MKRNFGRFIAMRYAPCVLNAKLRYALSAVRLAQCALLLALSSGLLALFWLYSLSSRLSALSSLRFALDGQWSVVGLKQGVGCRKNIVECCVVVK